MPDYFYNDIPVSEDRVLAAEISKKGEDFVKTTFSWDKYVDNMEKIFTKVKEKCSLNT